MIWQDPQWWQYIILCVGWMVAFSLGYGDGRNWWQRFFVGCCYAIPLLAIGINPWMAVIPVIFIVLFYLSNRPGVFADTVVWKIVEYVIGTSIGIAVAYFVKDNEWFMITAMAVGGIGFAAGGTDIPGIGGQKSIRRFLTPILLTGILILGI